MLITAQVLKEKWFTNHGFCSFTNNKQIKLVNEQGRPGLYRGFLNRVYGVLQHKYRYSVYHFL